jgi:hypothetical protein
MEIKKREGLTWVNLIVPTNDRRQKRPIRNNRR